MYVNGMTSAEAMTLDIAVMLGMADPTTHANTQYPTVVSAHHGALFGDDTDGLLKNLRSNRRYTILQAICEYRMLMLRHRMRVTRPLIMTKPLLPMFLPAR